MDVLAPPERTFLSLTMKILGTLKPIVTFTTTRNKLNADAIATHSSSNIGIL